MAKSKTIIGWQEWVSFPQLGIKHIKAKIDTGARTSALHAENILIRKARNGLLRAHFDVLPLKSNPRYRINCNAELIDQRFIRSSNGHRELRTTVSTYLSIGNLIYPIEITLTNRDSMGFRLLIGRTAVSKSFLIDAHRALMLGRKK